MRVTKTEMWDKRDSSDWGESKGGGEEGENATFHNKVRPRAVRLVWREDPCGTEPRNLKSILLI